MDFLVLPESNTSEEQNIPYGKNQLRWPGADLNIAGLALILVSENGKSQLRYPMNPIKRSFTVNIKNYRKAYLTYRFTDQSCELKFELS